VSTDISKRRAEDELPDQATVDAVGLGVELEEARAILAIASRMLVHGKGQVRGELERAMRTVVVAVSLALEDEDGDEIPALVASAPPRLLTSARWAAIRLGVNPMDLNRAWSDGRVFASSCFSLDCVLEFLPKPAWKYLAAFLCCGPSEARLRIEAAASVRGKGLEPRTLANQLNNVQTLMSKAVELRAAHLAANDVRARKGLDGVSVPMPVDRWTYTPSKLTEQEVRLKATGGKKRDTSAVPVETVRERLHELARLADWGKHLPGEWPCKYRWSRLRRLVVLAILATAAPRVEQLAALMIEDFVPEYVFQDGTIGPALLLWGHRNMKGRGLKNDYVLAIRLPRVVADIVTAWIRCNGSEIGALGRRLIPPTTRSDGESQQLPHTALKTFISGIRPSSTRGGNRPLIPLPGEEWEGYESHRLRSTLEQRVDVLVARFFDDNPHHELRGYPRTFFGECVLDHTIKDLGYRDIRTPDGYPSYRLEQMAALAVDLLWQDVWGDGPYLRRGLDPGAIATAHERLELLQAQLADLEARSATLRARGEAIRERAARGDNSAATEAILMLHDLTEVYAARDRILAELPSATRDLESAMENEVLLPEDMDEHEHAELLRAVLALVEPSVASEQPLADEAGEVLPETLSTAYVAELFDLTPQQIGRWRRGESNPPIPPEAWIKINERRYELPVSALTDAVLKRVPSADAARRLLEIRRRYATELWGDYREIAA
jgi:hypothetical protein